jgi:hypothetical protein
MVGIPDYITEWLQFRNILWKQGLFLTTIPCPANEITLYLFIIYVISAIFTQHLPNERILGTILPFQRSYEPARGFRRGKKFQG